MNYSLLEHNLPPLIIRKDHRNEYITLLGDAQSKQFPEQKKIQRFASFAKPFMEEERKRMAAFFHKKLNQIDHITESEEEAKNRMKKETLFKKGDQNK